MTRIYGEAVDLEMGKVHEFFENRGRTINSQHPITSVIYQDQNPALAARRDAFEKHRVLPLLKLFPAATVLDVGCGIGRWADALVGQVGRYHGVDFSKSFITAARERHTDPTFTFQVLAAQEVQPATMPLSQAATHVVVAGVLIYLNDEDMKKALRSIAACCAERALIYLREPVAQIERLTLSNFPSVELNSAYNAIYRTEGELLAAFEECLFSTGFRVELNDELYPRDMNNRDETVQRIFILQR